MKLLTKLQHRLTRLWQADVIFWKRHKKKILSGLFLTFHVLGALSSVNAIMHTRTPQGAIAWAVSLNTFPYIAVPAYWIFGASEFDDYIVARQKTRESGEAIRKDIYSQLQSNGLLPKTLSTSDRVYEKLAGNLPFTEGNSAEYLLNGSNAYKSMLEGIDRAKDYILFQFYIIRDDDIGRQFRDALLKKAQAGVKVYAMYDEVGSLGLPESFYEPLVKAGGQFIPFNTTQGAGNRFRLNFRNHRKVVVIDGRETWIGGINIGEEYSSSSAPEGEFMRDTHLHMSGPVVQMVQAIFIEDWYWAARNYPRLNWVPQRISSSNIKMLPLPTGPTDPLEYCTLFNLAAINKAQKRIWISTPYFVPDQQVISALALAVLRGVDVRIMIPEKTDSFLINLSHKGMIGVMKNTGVKMFHYVKGFNHQKVMLVDERYSFVGTANFDNRSFRLNFEVTMLLDDEAFGQQTEEMLTQDFADSKPVPADEFEKRNFFERFLSRTSLLLAPVQ